MSEEPQKIYIGGCAWLILAWMLCALAFCGDPDLHDAVIERVQSECRQ